MAEVDDPPGHAVGALAPVLLVYVPGGLGVHSPIPPTENDPGGHGMPALAPVPFVCRNSLVVALHLVDAAHEARTTTRAEKEVR